MVFCNIFGSSVSRVFTSLQTLPQTYFPLNANQQKEGVPKVAEKTRLLPKQVPRGAIGAQRTNFYIEHTYIRTSYEHT